MFLIAVTGACKACFFDYPLDGVNLVVLRRFDCATPKTLNIFNPIFHPRRDCLRKDERL